MRLRRLPLFFCATLVAAAANAPRFAFSFPSSTHGTAAVAVDSIGYTYLAGTVTGNEFTATAGAFQSQYTGGTCYGDGGFGIPFPIPCDNPFVVKLDPSGAVIFATYLAGSSHATPSAIAFDSQGNVYVAGTVEGDFPVTPGAAFSSPPQDAIYSFIAKLNSSGTQLGYATFIPATIEAIAVDAGGSVYFTGATSYEVPFPTTAGAFQVTLPNPTGGAVVGKLNASGSALVFGTYLSGTLGFSNGAGIAVDSAGNVLVGGSTAASDFPATEGQFVNGVTPQNLFLAKLNSGGSALIYSALLGPGGCGAMGVSPGGDVYFGCFANASDLPAATAPFGGSAPTSGGNDYLYHVSADGSTLLSTAYLPFDLSAVPGALTVDSGGNAIVLGYGIVATTAGAFQPSPPQPDDQGGQIVVAKISLDGHVAGVTYAGILAINSATVLAAERDGSVVVAGNMTSSFSAINFFPAVTVQNSASFTANIVVPGEMVAIRGYGIGPAAGVTSSPVDVLGGVQVYFDNFAAPLIYAQADQINVQAPWEIAGQATTEVQIQYNGALAGRAAVPVAQALPGVFYIENSDGWFNSPANPARPGDFVAVYGTGGGAMSISGTTGGSWPLSPLSYLSQSVSVTVGGESAVVLYGGSGPTLGSGFFQIDVRLPADLTSTAQLICVSIGGVAGAPAPISIQ